MPQELLKTFANVVDLGKQFMAASERLNTLIHEPVTEQQLDDLLTVYEAHGQVNGNTVEGALNWWKDVVGVISALHLAAELARDTLETQPLGERMLPAAPEQGHKQGQGQRQAGEPLKATIYDATGEK